MNTRVASEIENQFNNLFSEGKIAVENLTAKDVYYSNISPVKKKVGRPTATSENLPNCII